MNRLIIILFMAGVATGQPRTPTGEEILRLCEQNFAGIEDYTVDLRADLNMERARIPRMEATMYFKTPDKLHFVSANFAMLPREGFGLPVTALVKQYDPFYKGEEIIGGIKTQKLQLVAKKTTTRLQQLIIWVNPTNSTFVRVETVPYQGRTVTMEFTYALHEGTYWLPATLETRFTVVVPDTAGGEDSPIPAPPQLAEFRRPPRSGSISVSYSNYRVNTGLSDEFFERKFKE